MVHNPTFTDAAISGECVTLGLVGKCCSCNIVHTVSLSAHQTPSLYTNCDTAIVHALSILSISTHHVCCNCLNPASWQMETACQIVWACAHVSCCYMTPKMMWT